MRESMLRRLCVTKQVVQRTTPGWWAKSEAAAAGFTASSARRRRWHWLQNTRAQHTIAYRHSRRSDSRGDPTPPGTLSGALVKKKVQRFSCSHILESFSKSHISPIGHPLIAINHSCTVIEQIQSGEVRHRSKWGVRLTEDISLRRPGFKSYHVASNCCKVVVPGRESIQNQHHRWWQERASAPGRTRRIRRHP